MWTTQRRFSSTRRFLDGFCSFSKQDLADCKHEHQQLQQQMLQSSAARAVAAVTTAVGTVAATFARGAAANPGTATAVEDGRAAVAACRAAVTTAAAAGSAANPATATAVAVIVFQLPLVRSVLHPLVSAFLLPIVTAVAEPSVAPWPRPWVPNPAPFAVRAPLHLEMETQLAAIEFDE